jgi:ABC-type phosphate transport system auxiliary subunit
MGKKAKEHRKKVAARNQKIKAEHKKIQKEYMKMFESQLEQLKAKFSSETENDLNIAIEGEEIPFEVLKTNE